MNQVLNSNQVYRTSDLTLTTALSLSFPIVQIDRTDTRKAVFIFKKSEEMELFVEKYWNSEIRVEPQEFANQMKLIKTRIYSNE